jgi:hypothetical protein
MTKKWSFQPLVVCVFDGGGGVRVRWWWADAFDNVAASTWCLL